VLSWPEVVSLPHRFGGTEFRCRGKEIGHVHGDGLCDIPLPKAVRDEAVAAGKAKPHHIFPESGWVSVYLASERDAGHAIEMMRRKYRLILDRERRDAE